MNSKKYRKALYKFRHISDLKNMVDTSAELFADKTAYLVKNKNEKEYSPITFKEFKGDIDCLGTSFVEMGLKGKKIAVIGENSYKWVVTYLATTNGTGTIVPLDKELSPSEIANLINRAEVSAIVYSEKLSKTVSEISDMLEKPLEYKICMDKVDEEDVLDIDLLILKGATLIVQGYKDFINAKIDKNVMCALLFTSGTTGLAKGVMLSHKNIVSNVYNLSKYVAVKPDDIGLSVLPMHHTYEMTCHILTSIYQGMGVAICEGLKHITKNMAEAKVSIMLGVPLVFETIYKRIKKQAQNSGKLGKMQKMIYISNMLKLYNNKPDILKTAFKEVHEALGGHMNLFIVGGAAGDPNVISDMQAMGIPMIQGYGMTENAPIIAVNKDRYSKPASVGLPMPGTKIKIENPDKNGIGEIICKGDSVMLGYYNDPERTSEVLKKGWLHTGDYGYFDDEGFLYICGRKKSVIVTKNGKNIFPEEVEFYLLQSPYIKEVLVYGLEDEKSSDTLVKAEIFLDMELLREEKGDLETEELRMFVKKTIDDINEEMPLYKRVKRFSIREVEFEKTTTRKIKRVQSNMTE